MVWAVGGWEEEEGRGTDLEGDQWLFGYININVSFPWENLIANNNNNEKPIYI